MNNENDFRRKRAKVSVLGTTQMHLRPPWVIALWSGIFPGMGHLLLSKYISGFILFAWEVIINLKSHLNLSIFYSFTGEFETAKSVLDTRWLLLYIPTYLFAVWDSYRTAVDMNNNYILASREDAYVKPFVVSPLGFNYMDQSPPWVAAIWSMFSPGTGQLVIHRVLVAFFLIPGWIVAAHMSNILPAIHHTALLHFDLAKMVVDKQWLLNIPSLFFFGIYDAYTNTVESNKLYEWEQSKFLRAEYQHSRFKMPFAEVVKKGANMYIVSNFKHSIRIETAVTELQMKGIPKADILAVPLDKKDDKRQLLDSIHDSDRVSTLDIPIILAATFALLGMIYGFLLTWGPILWALIGTAVGFGVGLLIKRLTVYRKSNKEKRDTSVVLIVACPDTQADMIRDVLWANGALGASRLSLEP